MCFNALGRGPHSSPDNPAPRLPLCEFSTRAAAVAGAGVEQQGSAAANSRKCARVCGCTVLLPLLEERTRSGRRAALSIMLQARGPDLGPQAPPFVGSVAHPVARFGSLLCSPLCLLHPSVRLFISCLLVPAIPDPVIP
ncbi:hypothetical protein NDU88_000323 [Pleurodeles waltl]|uniref:Uncharacterized protein n=1 Tax=Pleurodeles waltl TaxID=8319 RepID=A0AAV7URH6_PLEWA|nr:hypothetical protein NDU88_000323 [Pleurodeles waltl]